MIKNFQSHSLVTISGTGQSDQEPVHTSLDTILSRFSPVDFSDISHATLQNRKELKYLLTTQQALDLLLHLPETYQIFEVDGKQVQTYKTTYYDSPEFQLYLAHHNGRKPRYKVRMRTYIGSDLTFLEVKEKKNTGRTIKHRLQIEGLVTRLGSDIREFLSLCFPFDYTEYKPVLINEYRRITLVSAVHPERITLDIDLTFRSGSIDILLPNIVIAEIKRSSDHIRSPALDYLNTMRLRPRGFSKYCIGISLLYGDLVKHNNFRIILRMLNKLTNGGPVLW
ncbi:polyphosphate polymerase domain-containing protein [Methanospirillum hungatei]|uniref:polyphosphate polymerase domain-containing protein n=1 Tax=Methanospirillum hungatei TaxID=2203 RepID=UPI0026ED76DD|nr:polyphosphate polymerase domain-containing protein [Methanospirillum hungatei]MCA1916710.1 polyphosphate polymerase domain-containing protein [Methanospirillum hungatei]